MKHILVIDDDININDMIAEVLKREGFRVSQAYSGTECLLLLAGCKPDLVLLDLMLPGLSGEEVLKRISGIPVIVVSAKIDVNDKVSVLLAGAADYITKPFDTKELLARVAVQLRKAESTIEPATLSFSELTLQTDSHIVLINGKEVKLTRTEYAIMKILIQNATQVITKTMLLDRIAEDTPDCTDSSLKMHISNLRKKLRDISGKEYIEAVWGIGFKLSAE